MTWSGGIIYPPDVGGSDPISRKHVSFGIAGLIFGFLLGYVVSHEVSGGRFAGVARAGGPAAPPPGAMPRMSGAAPPGNGQAAAPSMETMEQVRKELEALKKAISENPRDVLALTRMGDLYMDAGMFDKAAEYYASALEVEPANVDVRTDMGTCLRQMGRQQEALEVFRESVARDPKHWKSWFNIGIITLYDLGDYRQAEEAFGKVLELNPGSFDMEAVRDEIEKVKSQKAAEASSGSPS